MNNLLDTNYLFSTLPGDPNLGFWQPILVISCVLIVSGTICFFIARKFKEDGLRRHLAQRYGTWALTFAAVALLLAFFRFQNAYLLSMRALIFVWIAFCAVWVIRIIVYHIWKLPKKLRARDEKAFFEKYLPHKKK